jgi:hypothetical protein
LQRIQRGAHRSHTALLQRGLPSSCAPAHTGVVSVTRAQLKHRHRPSTVSITPWVLLFVVVATCLPSPGLCIEYTLGSALLPADAAGFLGRASNACLA